MHKPIILQKKLVMANSYQIVNMDCEKVKKKRIWIINYILAYYKKYETFDFSSNQPSISCGSCNCNNCQPFGHDKMAAINTTKHSTKTLEPK